MGAPVQPAVVVASERVAELDEGVRVGAARAPRVAVASHPLAPRGHEPPSRLERALLLVEAVAEQLAVLRHAEPPAERAVRLVAGPGRPDVAAAPAERIAGAAALECRSDVEEGERQAAAHRREPPQRPVAAERRGLAEGLARERELVRHDEVHVGRADRGEPLAARVQQRAPALDVLGGEARLLGEGGERRVLAAGDEQPAVAADEHVLRHVDDRRVPRVLGGERRRHRHAARPYDTAVDGASDGPRRSSRTRARSGRTSPSSSSA